MIHVCPYIRIYIYVYTYMYRKSRIGTPLIVSRSLRLLILEKWNTFKSGTIIKVKRDGKHFYKSI